jgi:hypothetical protein
MKHVLKQKKCRVSTIKTGNIKMKLSYLLFALLMVAFAAGNSAAQVPNSLNAPSAQPGSNAAHNTDSLSQDNSGTSSPQLNSANCSFSMYPNPAGTLLTIVIDKYSGDGLAIELYSMKGELAKSVILTGYKNELDISTLGNGIYIVYLRRNGESEMQKLVIQR